MIRFTPEKFERYAAKQPSGWRAMALARSRVSPEAIEVPPEVITPRGLGDVVESLAKPFARALRLPCLDEQGNLRPESGCGKRHAALNRIVPKL